MTAGGDAGYEPADHQPRQRRRERHEDVVEAQSEVRQQDDRTPAESIGQRAENGRGQKLH
jgi:hypothetical protein